MSAFPRLPKTPASGIIHTWRIDIDLAYGQVRESLTHPEHRFLLLCPIPERATWSVLLLSGEISEHGIDFIRGGTRAVTP